MLRPHEAEALLLAKHRPTYCLQARLVLLLQVDLRRPVHYRTAVAFICQHRHTVCRCVAVPPP